MVAPSLGTPHGKLATRAATVQADNHELFMVSSPTGNDATVIS